MRKQLRFLVGLVAVPFVVLMLMGSSGSTEQEAYRYLLPPGVVAEGEPHALSARAQVTDDGPVVGNPVVLVSEPVHTLSVAFDDDHYGDQVPITVCMDGETDGTCNGSVFGPHCGPFSIEVLPRPSETTVYAYSIIVDEEFDVCGATAGTVSVEWS